MVQRIQTLCDRCMARDNKEVDADAGTVSMAVMKKVMEIDLCLPCFAELNEILEPYWEVGRRPGKAAFAPTPTPPRRPAVAAAENGRTYKPGDEPNGPTLDGRPTWLCRAPNVDCDRKDPDNPKGPFESLLATSIHESRAHNWRNDGQPRGSRPKKAPAKAAAKPAKRGASQELADATA